MASAKDRAVELYNQHIALASTDGRLFRKTVMDTLQTEFSCSVAAAATHYNNAKKAHEASNGAIAGLGRAPAPKGVRKPGSGKTKKDEDLQPDNECFAVIEVLKDGTVGRTQTFLMQGDASEKYDEKVGYRPDIHWVMMQGLGPMSGDNFRLGAGEKIIKENKQEVTA